MCNLQGWPIGSTTERLDIIYNISKSLFLTNNGALIDNQIWYNSYQISDMSIT